MIDVECPPEPTAPVEYESGSFRDRSSRVFHQHGRVYRALSDSSLADWEALSAAPFFQRAMRDGKIVHSFRVSDDSVVRRGSHDCAERVDRRSLDNAWRPAADSVDRSGEPSTTGSFTDAAEAQSQWAAVLQHDRIPFISYPYEWCFSMLRDAALLHLELMTAALQEEFILKDASAFNVQWDGASPVFIDVGSFTRHPAGQPWLAYRQFCQMFLYPLLLQAHRNVDFQPWLRGALDGIPPAQFLNLLSFRDLFRRGVFTHGWLHAKLESGFGAGSDRISDSLQTSGFQRTLIQNNVRKLTALVSGLRSRPPRSSWTDYRAEAISSQNDGDAKADFVSSVAYSRPWSLVWDLGCNTGRFSRIAAENAQYVVAVDSDPACIEDLYQSLRREKTPHILPLVNNLADPSPALGWRGKERQTLPDRGRPELTLCLALIHHLVIGANVLLTELLDWLAGLNSHLVIEFVDKDDPMVRALLRNKADQYADYSQAAFEQGLAARFDLLRREPLPSGTRTLYYAVPRS